MSARAAAVILTDTKSLSRFSVIKFSSVNVQLSPVFRLLLLPPKGHSLLLLLSLSPGNFAGLVSFAHSLVHARVFEQTFTGVRAATSNTLRTQVERGI